jgi:hypothetical protein
MDNLNSIMNQRQNDLKLFENKNNKERKKIEYNKKTNKNVLIINSKDRNWLKNKTTFDFSVNISPDKFNDDSFILKNLKNIRSISIDHILIPNFFLNLKEVHFLAQNDQLNINTLNPLKLQRLSDLPYIILNIEDINNTLDGTNNVINRSTSVLILDKKFDINSNNGKYYHNRNSENNEVLSLLNNSNDSLIENQSEYLYFKNTTYWSKLYYPNPKSLIGSLNISILNPHGEKLKLLNDSLEIKFIEYLNLNTNPNDIKKHTIKLTLKNFFSSEEYKVGVNILFKDVILKNNHSLETFLNKESGHTIIKTSLDLNYIYVNPNFIQKYNNSKIKNVIFIPFENNFNLNNGLFDTTEETNYYNLNYTYLKSFGTENYQYAETSDINKMNILESNYRYINIYSDYIIHIYTNQKNEDGTEIDFDEENYERDLFMSSNIIDGYTLQDGDLVLLDQGVKNASGSLNFQYLDNIYVYTELDSDPDGNPIPDPEGINDTNLISNASGGFIKNTKTKFTLKKFTNFNNLNNINNGKLFYIQNGNKNKNKVLQNKIQVDEIGSQNELKNIHKHQYGIYFNSFNVKNSKIKCVTTDIDSEYLKDKFLIGYYVTDNFAKVISSSFNNDLYCKKVSGDYNTTNGITIEGWNENELSIDGIILKEGDLIIIKDNKVQINNDTVQNGESIDNSRGNGLFRFGYYTFDNSYNSFTKDHVGIDITSDLKPNYINFTNGNISGFFLRRYKYISSIPNIAPHPFMTGVKVNVQVTMIPLEQNIINANIYYTSNNTFTNNNDYPDVFFVTDGQNNKNKMFKTRVNLQYDKDYADKRDLTSGFIEPAIYGDTVDFVQINEVPTSGSLINLNLQNLTTIQIETEEKDNSNFFTNLT